MIHTASKTSIDSNPHGVKNQSGSNKKPNLLDKNLKNKKNPTTKTREVNIERITMSILVKKDFVLFIIV